MNIIPSNLAGSVDLEELTLSSGNGTWYKLTAHANQGYVFEYFEWSQRIYWTGGSYHPDPRIEQKSAGSPTTENNSPMFRSVDLGQPYGIQHSDLYGEITAVFRWDGPGPGPGPGPEPEKYTITISADPEDGGSVSGGGTYSSGVSVTLTANRSDGYELTSLENSADGVVIYPTHPPCFGKSISHTISVTKSSSWVAHFRKCTKKILRGHSGNILRGKDSKILRDN